MRHRSNPALYAAILCGAPAAFAQTTYTITDLGSLPGGSEAAAFAINDAGQVTGWARVNQAFAFERAFRWQGGVMTNLGSLPASIGTTEEAFGFAINAAGHVAGAASIVNSIGGRNNQAFLRTDGGTFVLQATFPVNYALGVNDVGVTVGACTNGPAPRGIYEMQAAIWPTPSSQVQFIGHLGGRFSQANAINNAGQVVGFSLPAAGPRLAFFWPGSGPLVAIPGLGGNGSEATDINTAGTVVGWAAIPSGAHRAFLFDGFTTVNLGVPPNGTTSRALAINDSGVIVGTTWISGQGPRAWVRHGSTMSNLNELVPPGSGWILQYARGINAQGQIVGEGRLNMGGTYFTRAFLLTPSAGCYPNCDGSSTPPVLNVGDFTCFLQRFAAGESYANCDNSTVPPVLNVADFTCFLQRFAAGCP
jgi:probable HAF family extracellular repeat protein